MTQDEVLNLAREADGQVTMWVNHSTIQKTTTFTFESPIDYRQRRLPRDVPHQILGKVCQTCIRQGKRSLCKDC